MKKLDLKKLDKVSYVVGIVVAAGGLVSALIGEKDNKDLSNRIDELEKKLSDK